MVGESAGVRINDGKPSAVCASPKSSTFTTMSGVSITLPGLRSRWITLYSWGTSSALAICLTIKTASSTGIALRQPIGQRPAFDVFQDAGTRVLLPL
jgi:hypothetical protein